MPHGGNYKSGGLHLRLPHWHMPRVRARTSLATYPRHGLAQAATIPTHSVFEEALQRGHKASVQERAGIVVHATGGYLGLQGTRPVSTQLFHQRNEMLGGRADRGVPSQAWQAPVSIPLGRLPTAIPTITRAASGGPHRGPPVREAHWEGLRGVPLATQRHAQLVPQFWKQWGRDKRRGRAQRGNEWRGAGGLPAHP